MDKILIGKEYCKELLELIQREKETIDLCIYEMFSRSAILANSVDDVKMKLRTSSLQGVKIRVLINQTLHREETLRKMSDFINCLSSSGAKINQIKRGVLMHAKAIQFGKTVLLVGSHNLSDRSFVSNLEISVRTEDKEINKKYRQWFDTFFS